MNPTICGFFLEYPILIGMPIMLPACRNPPEFDTSMNAKTPVIITTTGVYTSGIWNRDVVTCRSMDLYPTTSIPSGT